MARFHSYGNVWELELSHDEVEAVRSGLDGVNTIATAVAQVWLVPILKMTGAVLAVVDAIGLHHGVRVVGVFGTQLVTVTPNFVSPVEMLRSFADRLVQATDLPPELLGGVTGSVIGALALGPGGVVMGGVAGWLGALGRDSPNPGDVHSDRTAIGPWERFIPLMQSNDTISIASWRGFFCAENGGGGDVHANRSAIGPWELFTLFRNANGTVSLRSVNGHFLVAENGGGPGSFCRWNRTGIGEWEQFWMEFQPDGTFALRTLNHRTFVSVQ